MRVGVRGGYASSRVLIDNKSSSSTNSSRGERESEEGHVKSEKGKKSHKCHFTYTVLKSSKQEG